MKKILALALVCAAVATAQAQKGWTDEQKATKTELISKYDTNKDGKLDKSEIAAMSADDKAKWKALPKTGHHKKAADTDSSTNSVGTSTNSVK